MNPSDIVRSMRGHDEGSLCFVLKKEDAWLFLADGKLRRVEKPKRKKEKHAAFVAVSDSYAAQKIRAGEKVTNSELRKTLLAFEKQEKEGL